jgi:protein-disulfide isomerase
MARIFISYSRRDKAFAEQLTADLEGLDVDVWRDVDDIRAGLKWSTAIQQGLDDCDVMIVIISPDSMGSVNVEDEWQYYLDQRKPLVPVLWRPANVHFQLSRIQYIDFHSQDYSAAFAQLHSELRRQGIPLAPLSLADPGVQIPTQELLPIQPTPVGRQRIYWSIGGVITALLVAGAALAISALSGDTGGDRGQSDVTATWAAQAPIVLPETQVWLDFTATADARPTATSTATDAPSSTPDFNATYHAESTKAMATIMAGWTSTPLPTETPSPTTIVITPDLAEDDDPFLGPADAPVVLVEFADFQCGYCEQWRRETLPKILAKYPTQVKYVYRDFTIFGQESLRAATAADCANEQGKFWDMHNRLFDRQKNEEHSLLNDETFVSYADELHMDTAAFSECLTSERYVNEVLDDYRAAQQYGLKGTPGFIINGVVYTTGAQPFEVFDTIIQDELARVQNER